MWGGDNIPETRNRQVTSPTTWTYHSACNMWHHRHHQTITIIIIIIIINLIHFKWSQQGHGTVKESTDWADHFAWRESEPADINSQWKESWKLASVVNAHLVDDPTIRQPGFALPRQQWSLLNRFRTGQGHCGACKKKWKLSDSDQCSCDETQTMSHIVESCP